MFGTSYLIIRIKTRYLSLLRRLSILFTGKFDPYPQRSEDLMLSPSDVHFSEYEKVPLSLSWANTKSDEVKNWQIHARKKLEELIGYKRPSIIPSVKKIKINNLSEKINKICIYLSVGENSDIPVEVLWSGSDLKERSIMICLQGHNSGAHLSWGEVRMPSDPDKIYNGADYALQAVNNGFIAVCVEQSCFGQRQEKFIKKPSPHPCFDAAHNALLIGHTLLGERVADVSVVINWLLTNPVKIPAHNNKIYLMGNSTGGDISVYAAAVDERITGIIASGCVGSYRETIGRRAACPDAIIPGVLKWLEYEDILAICAPRPVLVISGINDHIYPYSEAKVTADRAFSVFENLGASTKLKVVSGPEGHRFYPDIAWPIFLEMIKN